MTFVGPWPLTSRSNPYGHAPTYQISLTYLERQKCYGTNKKILFKKQLFDLEVKGQGPTKVIIVRDTQPYGHAPRTVMTFMGPWPLTSSSNNCFFRDRSMIFGMWMHDLKAVCHIPQWPSLMTRKYYLKSHYLTLRSKVKVPRRSLRYSTHRLMVMHPHTISHMTIRRCVAYRNDLCGTLTFDLKVN
jgi:hypothetical protein